MTTSHRTKGVLLIALGIFALAGMLAYFDGGKPRVKTFSLALPTMMGQDGSVAGNAYYADEEAARDMAYGESGIMVIGKATAPGMPVADVDRVSIGMMPAPMPPSAGPVGGMMEQRVIKNGNLDLVVASVQDGIGNVMAIASAHKGFVQQSSVNERGDGTFSGYVTVRVPSSDFEAAMSEIKGVATLVKSESVSGQDVTEQYTDLEARLRNAKAQEETYLDVLDRANSVEDILAVQRELSNVRYQIESLEGQRQYLENQTSFSTIGVTLSEEAAVRVPTKEFRPLAAAKEALQALIRALQSLVLFFIWAVIIGIGVLIPFLLFWWVLLLVGRFVWRRFMKDAFVVPPTTTKKK